VPNCTILIKAERNPNLSVRLKQGSIQVGMVKHHPLKSVLNPYQKKLRTGNFTMIDDSNWREEYKGYTSSKYELELLENGPKSLAQSWMMGALHNKWKKMKGYKDPEPPDCQSSFKEWNNGIKV
jgi:hypothetical protein